MRLLFLGPATSPHATRWVARLRDSGHEVLHGTVHADPDARLGEATALVTYPRPKFASKRKGVAALILGPALVLGLVDLLFAILRMPGFAEIESLVRLVAGILLVLFLVLALVAALHSCVAATREERRSQGLNVVLAGVTAGFLPLLLSDLVLMLMGIETSRAMDVAIMMIAVVPMGLAIGAVRGERARAES